MDKPRVIVVVEDGVVKRVATNNEAIQVLVLDTDTEGCDDDTKFRVAGSSAALDALRQGLPQVNSKSVEAAFRSFEAYLTKLLSPATDSWLGGKDKLKQLKAKWFA